MRAVFATLSLACSALVGVVVSATCPADPENGKRSAVGQFGITWTFDKKHETGQFANGDWWVVGPVKIVKIDPPSRSGPRILNGSMLDPDPKLGNKQGYDSAMEHNEFVKALNVALDLSKSKPLKVAPGSSLVSTISVPAAKKRPQIQGCAILTILARAAKPGDFRPAYCGKKKSIRYHVRDLDMTKLAQLKPVGDVPSVASVERMFERPWLDHAPRWMGRYQHPADNMKDYGRDLSADVAVGALMLHLNFSKERKKVLLVRYVQLGIDLMGIVEAGATDQWRNDGGHGSGRKWPILFAGLMLGDKAMKGIGKHPSIEFAEDQQTFFVAKKGNEINGGHGGYGEAELGLPDWGIRHATEPKRDDKRWTAKYRQCCTANSWNGFVLAARIMDAQKFWNHDALFAYVDRYVAESRARGDAAWMLSWSSWTIQMWDAYRKKY